MSRLIWSPAALLDVQRLYRFLALKNVDVARRAVKVIRDGVRMIGLQPAAGRPVPELDPAYREWLIDFGDSGYLALYHFDGETAVIVAVRHQKEAGY